MATLANLVMQGTLLRIDVPLSPGELPMRVLYGRQPIFTQWLGTQLLNEAADWGGRQAPDEQVDELFYRFVAGHPLEDERDLRLLKPVECCIWELKTIDVRIFGWFPGRDVFIAVTGDMKRKVMQMSYGGYRDEACLVRNRLDLDEPKYLKGIEVGDVLSL